MNKGSRSDAANVSSFQITSNESPMKTGTPFRDGAKGWVSASSAARRIPFVGDSDKKH